MGLFNHVLQKCVAPAPAPTLLGHASVMLLVPESDKGEAEPLVGSLDM